VEAAAGGRGRLVTLPFALVTGATLAYFTCLGALLPIVPRYVEDELHGGGLAVGVAVGSFAVSAALLRPWVGRLGDVHGRRILVVGGSAIVGLSVLGYSLASNLFVLVLLRLVTGVGEAAMWIGAATAVQDMAPDDRRGEAASYFSVALYAGLAIGPFAGERLRATHGFTSVWIMCAGCALVACVLGSRTPQGTPATAEAGAGRARLLHPAALGPGLVLLLGLIPFTGFSAFLALYGPEVGIDDVGPVFAVYAGLVLLIRITAARLPDRLGWRLASTGALLSVAVAAALIGLWASQLAVYVSAVFMAFGMSLLFPALFSAVINATPESERSQAVGTFSVFFDLSGGLGAPLLGIVVGLTDSYRAAFLASGLAAIGGFAAMRALHVRSTGLDLEDPALY
jgi:MFS family permease